MVRWHGDIAWFPFRTDGHAKATGLIPMDAIGGWQARARGLLGAIKGGDDATPSVSLAHWTSTAGKCPRLLAEAVAIP